MAIVFQCHCGRTQRVSSKYAGQHAHCGSCGESLVIPLQSARQSSTSHPALSQSSNANVAIAIPTAASVGLGDQLPIAESKSEPELPIAESMEDLPVADPAPVSQPEIANELSAGPMLHEVQSKSSLLCRPLASEVKKIPDTDLISSKVYSLNSEPRSRFRVGWQSEFGSTKLDDLGVDRIEVFHLRDSLGDYAIIAPFEGLFPCPIEYVSMMKGCLSDSVLLLKTSGDKNLELGSAVGGPLGAVLSRVGKTTTVWTTCNGSASTLAQAAESTEALNQGITWDGKLLMGDHEAFYHLRWGVQAIPVGDNHYLLVAQSVPKRKVIGLKFNVRWYSQYRRDFAQLVNKQPVSQGGPFQYVDPGTWLCTAVEALDWMDL